jgi:hypothetical protein
MNLPPLLPNGYLPPGIHQATLDEIAAHFGSATPRRQVLAGRLQELLAPARATRKLRRVFLWGSFVTAKPFPGDLDVFLLMQTGFDQEFTGLPPEQGNLFDHGRARLRFEADVFWATEAIGKEELDSWLSIYQLSRDMVERGIVEVHFDD